LTEDAERPNVIDVTSTDLLTIKETRVYLRGISRETLRQMEIRGELLPTRVGKKVYYRRAVLEAYLDVYRPRLEGIQ
jgi:hypothetical protein